MFIAENVKSFSLPEPGESRSKIHEAYGKPQHSVVYRNPPLLTSIPEIRRKAIPHGAVNKRAHLREDFVLRGRITSGGDVGKAELIAWYSAGSLWLAEPILAPVAASEMVSSHFDRHHVWVYYDANDRCLCISLPQEKSAAEGPAR